MPQFLINSPIKHGGKIRRDGEIELTAKAAASAVARGELEPLRESKPTKSEATKDAPTKTEPSKPTKPAKPAGK